MLARVGSRISSRAICGGGRIPSSQSLFTTSIPRSSSHTATSFNSVATTMMPSRITSASGAGRAFHSARRLSSEGGSLNYHVDEDWNNAAVPFDFLPELYEEIEVILKKYPTNRRQSGILPLLHLAQRQVGGWIPLSAMNKIADVLDVPALKVYECATFYSMFNREPIGKYHIQVCTTTPCMIVGSDDILEAIEKHLGIHLNETTADGIITLGTMECMGACVNAPMFVVSDYSNPPNFKYDFYEDLTVERAIEIVDSLRNGQMPPLGPQNGRKNAMGIQGKTTLLQPPRGPSCRTLTK